MILEPGTLLNNRYRIVEILGQGGMGSVYRATDENLDIDVAVKDNLFSSEEYARQFRREATILATLRHSCLPRVTDHFTIEGQGQYMVMDYIEGEDLRQRMERIRVLPEQEVVTIGAAICDALMYLCSRNPPVIHRDIKPGNVRITPEGQIYLVDFGLAKTLQGTQATTSGARAMTPGYSPPEQYGTARTDMRTDIFSLGATLYASLAGYTPEDALARAMNKAVLTPLRTHNPHVSRKVAAAIEKALELQPEDRFQIPAQFKQALLAATTPSRRSDGEYFVTPPPAFEIDKSFEVEVSDLVPVRPVQKPSGPPRSSKPRFQPQVDSNEPLAVADPFSKPSTGPRKRKGRIGCVLFSALFIILAGVAGVIYRENPLIGAYWLAQLLPPASAVPGVQASKLISALAPAASLQAATPMQLSTATRVAITGTPEPVIPSDTLPRTPQLSRLTQIPLFLPTPIGGGAGQLAYASNISGMPQIFLINSDGTNRRQVTEIPEGACQPDFSPEGERIIFVSPCDSTTDYYPGASLYIINLDGSGLLPLPTMLGGDFDPAWSPDGKTIVFTSLRNNRPQIYSLNLEDNSIKVLSEKYMIDSQPSWSPDGKKILFVTERNNRQDIWVMDADGKNQRLFTHTQNLLDYHPSFSPDGKAVLVTQYVALGGVPRVVIASFSLDDYVEYEIGKEKRPMRDAVMSPDGYWIAFEGWEIGGKHNIFLITTTGISIHQVTNDLNIAFDPAWRPFPLDEP